MMKNIFILMILSLTLVACNQQDMKKNPPQNRQDYDNTGKNIRDRDSVTTPLDQSESEADLAITQKIRQAIMSDGSLSTHAKNIKIITIKGVVTLRGPVASSQEKETIARTAKGVQGVVKVDNQLDVKRNNY